MRLKIYFARLLVLFAGITACTSPTTGFSVTSTATATIPPLPTATPLPTNPFGIVGVQGDDLGLLFPWLPPTLKEASLDHSAPLPGNYSARVDIMIALVLQDIPGATESGVVWNGGYEEYLRTAVWVMARDGNFIWQRSKTQAFAEYPLPWNGYQDGFVAGEAYAEIPDSQDAELSFTGAGAGGYGEKLALMKTIVMLADGKKKFLEYFDFATGGWRLNPNVLKAMLPEQGLAILQDDPSQWSAIDTDGRVIYTFDTGQNQWMKTPEALFLVQGLDIKDGQVYWGQPDEGKILIGAISTGEFVFTVSGQEISVDPLRVESPTAMWFLNGESDQIVVVYDESKIYWKYEWDRNEKLWQEKSLPVVNASYSPTKINWNDLVSNRWATAVRQAITQGQIGSLNSSAVTILPMVMNPDLFNQYGMDGPGFKNTGKEGETLPGEARPVKALAYAEIEVENNSALIVTEQFANAGGGYGLLNLLLSPLQASRIGNESRYFMPITRYGNLETVTKAWPASRPYIEWFIRNHNAPTDQLQSAVERWIDTNDVPVWFERLLFRTLVRNW